MISHYANPECAAAFHYLRGGKLYRFDLRKPQEPCRDVPNAICSGKPSHASVYFWLCDVCAHEHGLRFSLQEGISVYPLESSTVVNDAVVAHVADAGSICREEMKNGCTNNHA